MSLDDFNYYSGSGHPTPVDETGKNDQGYSDEKHGKGIVICTKRTQY